MNNVNVLIGDLIFNIGLPFRTFKSREMDGIILKTNKFNREYKISSRYTIREPILDA